MIFQIDREAGEKLFGLKPGEYLKQRVEQIPLGRIETRGGRGQPRGLPRLQQVVLHDRPGHQRHRWPRDALALSNGDLHDPTRSAVRDPRALILVTAALFATPASAQSGKPKRGGILNAMLIEDPPGLLVHESATISNVWPMSPCYSNLVIFDPLKPLESADTVIPELAERWSWQDNYRNLVFFLRKNVKWHDGKPFTSQDVKYTFDVVARGARRAGQAPAEPAQGLVRQRRGHRGARAAHGGVPAQAARSPRCCSCSPRATRRSIPAHVPLDELRQRCVGTGPFRLKEYAARAVRRAGAQPRLLRPRPALPRRHPLPDHHRARHAAGRAPGRPPRRLRAARDDEGDGRDGQDRARRRWSSPRSARTAATTW